MIRWRTSGRYDHWMRSDDKLQFQAFFSAGDHERFDVRPNQSGNRIQTGRARYEQRSSVMTSPVRIFHHLGNSHSPRMKDSSMP